MDEPCSALDPTSTRRIEETIAELQNEVTIVIVTHNMQQAQRVSQQVRVLPGGGEHAGPHRRVGSDERSVRLAEGPADRRLRQRPVRLSRWALVVTRYLPRKVWCGHPGGPRLDLRRICRVRTGVSA